MPVHTTFRRPEGAKPLPGFENPLDWKWSREVSDMKVIDRLALALVIIGGLNWGGIGIFGLDMVAALFGGSASVLSRLVYILVCISAIWCITLFFREETNERRARGTV